MMVYMRFMLMTLLLNGAWASADQEILTTIKPLALILEAVVADDVDVLLPTGVSPHHFSMRVSDMKRITTAELLLWIGPNFESFLSKPVDSGLKARVITASELEGIEWPIEHVIEHGADHNHGVVDFHIWLNPGNASVIAKAVAKELGGLNPTKSEVYKERALKFTRRMEKVNEEIKQALAEIQGSKFIAYHDAYRHYMEHFDLEQVGFVTSTVEQQLSARQLYALEKKSKEAHCLLVEPSTNMASSKEFARRVNLPMAVIDALAQDPKITTFEELLLSISYVLLTCHLVV